MSTGAGLSISKARCRQDSSGNACAKSYCPEQQH